MKIFKYPVIIFSMAVMVLLSSYAGNKFQFTDIENILVFLENAQAVSIQPDENAGRTEPWMVMLDDGEIRHKAIFKHIDRPRPYPLADSFKYELSAYKLHRRLGLNFIPPTVARKLNDRPGALQLYVENCVPLETAREDAKVKINPESVQSELRDIIVFDALTYCGCEESSDVLYQLSSGHICRVDYSQAFAPRRELPEECHIQGVSQGFLDELKSLKDEEVRSWLDSYLNEEEIDALLFRRHLILEKLQ